jgi:hypothetical protein
MAVLRSVMITIAFLLSLGMAAAQTENLQSPEQKALQEKAQQSKEGQAGTTEPSSEHSATSRDPNAVFVDGRLVAPGAPPDSQTVPAKYSKRNAALDALPTMAFPLPLNDEQRQRIREAVKQSPVANTNARSAELLPDAIDVHALPSQLTAEMPAVRNLGYVRTADRVLLIGPSNRVVVGEIKN